MSFACLLLGLSLLAPATADAAAEETPEPPPPPEPEPPPPPTGTMVHVAGTAKVILIRGGERIEVPGTVPPGEYEVEAAYTGGEPFAAGTLSARAGVDMKILCSEALKGCKIREY